MKISMRRSIAFTMLTASLIATAPAIARHGADDATEGASRSSDDSRGSHTSNDSKPTGKVTGKFNALIDSPRVKGKFKHTVKKKTEELSIKIKIGKGNLVTNENLDTGVVKAYFPDGEVCELELDDDLMLKYYEYSLKLRLKKGVYREKDGNCQIDGSGLSQIPAYASAPITIEFDADNNPDTLNTEIATGTFNP